MFTGHPIFAGASRAESLFAGVAVRLSPHLPYQRSQTGLMVHAFALADRVDADRWSYYVSSALWRLLERGCDFIEAFRQVDDGCPEWRDLGGEA